MLATLGVVAEQFFCCGSRASGTRPQLLEIGRHGFGPVKKDVLESQRHEVGLYHMGHHSTSRGTCHKGFMNFNPKGLKSKQPGTDMRNISLCKTQAKQ